MKTRLTILILLLTPIVNLFHSCKDPCKGHEPTKYGEYSYKTLLLKNLDYSEIHTPRQSDSVQFDENAYGIRLHLTREKIVIAYRKQINSILIQSAYALSTNCPPEYILSAKDSIVSIKILTLNDFDDQHSKNSDITAYFKVFAFSDVKDYVAGMSHTFEGERYNFEDGLRLDLKLMVAPTTTHNQQFKVIVELSDGRILEQQTTEIQLL
jgi:hypothetical protein